jgi:hypothetical protein
MSRAHVQGFDSNPAQFERMGNPWITPREQQELGEPNRRARKENKRLRPCQLEYREIKRIAREPTPEEAKRKAQRDTLWQIRRLDKALRLEEDRVAAVPPPPEPPVVVIRPVQDKPLSEFDPRRIAGDLQRLEREQRRARIQAKRDLGDWKAAAELELGAIAL